MLSNRLTIEFVEFWIGTKDTSRIADQLRIFAARESFHHYWDIQGRKGGHQEDHKEEGG